MAKRIQLRRRVAQPHGHLIAIRAHDDNKQLIEAYVPGTAAPAIGRMAVHWGYILRVRTRWVGDADIRDSFGEKAFDDLKSLGVGAEKIQRLASTNHIEVQLLPGASAASVLEAVSEIPWEYLLSQATRHVGRFESLLVTRCLPNTSVITPRRPRSILLVESAPGRIGQIYDFDDEEKRLKAAMDLAEPRDLEFSKTEPYTKLKDRLGKRPWEAIHVTGIDTHQAAWLIEDFYAKVARKAEVIDKSDYLQDGMIIRGDTDSELPVRYDELADLLLKSRKHPSLVTLNLYYSGARTARELVKRGAYAAVGFLDEIDDEFAELFFQALYWSWCRDNRTIPQAFLDAWSKMDADRMQGTSIVIWLGRSSVGQPDSKTPAKTSGPARRTRIGGR
jgi:hypothetical protein